MRKIFEKIYEVVKKIPKGKVVTYGEIAKKADTTPRAVGFALHKNPDPRNIPCHRVVFKDGSLTKSFAFGGIVKQKQLLAEEGIIFDSQDRVLPTQRESENRRRINYNSHKTRCVLMSRTHL